MDPDPRRRVAIFLHAGEYDRVHQGCSIAAAAASSGRDVQLFLFWWALDSLLDGGFERPSFTGERAAKVEDAFERGAPTAAQLLAAARETGRCTVYACSASAALLGRRQDEIAARVDLVVGWTAILALTEGVVDRFYL
jgi:peroxiredoxin family protein